MAVTGTTYKATGVGNGSATVFSFSPIILFEPRASSGTVHDLEVTKVAADGTETILTEGTGTTNYSVSVSTYPGTGSITYPATLGTKLATGETLVIKRKLELKQYEDLDNQGGYFADTQEEMHDRHRMVDQQQQEEIDRAVKVPIGGTDTPEDFYQSLLDTEANAAASATAAAGSATAAQTAETNAETAETNAETAETNAETAETNAAASAAAASTSATNSASAAAAVAHRFTFDTSTVMGDGGTGVLRFDNATVASVTAIAVTAESADAGNPDISDFVATWDDSSNTTVKSTLTIRKLGTPATFAIFTVSAVTDNGSWLQLTVAHVASGGAWSAADTMVVGQSRAGNKGVDGTGTVNTVSAANASIVVAGTATDPTVKVRDVAATARVLGRKTAGSGIMEDCTLSEVLDFIGSAAQGDILYRGAASWALLGAGTSGHFLKTNGAGADPAWAANSAVIVDRAYASYTSAANITGTIPVDDTIPQNTEGTQILSVSITPKSVTNRVRIRFQGQIANTTISVGICAALFINSTADALAAENMQAQGNGYYSPVVLEFEHVPGSTSAQTYNIRVGPPSGSAYANAQSGGTRNFGGVSLCTLIAEEITA